MGMDQYHSDYHRIIVITIGFTIDLPRSILYGYGSIPIHTIFSGLFTSINPSYDLGLGYQGFDSYPYDHIVIIPMSWKLSKNSKHVFGFPHGNTCKEGQVSNVVPLSWSMVGDPGTGQITNVSPFLRVPWSKCRVFCFENAPWSAPR